VKRLLLVVALCACDKARPGEHCAAAADYASAVIGAPEMKRPQREEDELAARASQFGSALEARCREDKWPGDVTACLVKVQRRDDVASCWSTLPADQRARLADILATFNDARR
jgi:hypothetical protein